jgi:hypothetical protein
MGESQEELPFDWHSYVPTEGEIRESLNKASAELPIGEGRDPNKYATPEDFVAQYANALQDYLTRTLGKGESHIEDLGANAGAFSEAFLAIIGWF